MIFPNKEKLGYYLKVFSGARGIATSSLEFLDNILIQSGILSAGAMRLPFLVLFIPLFKSSFILSHLYSEMKVAYKSEHCKQTTSNDQLILNKYKNTTLCLLKIAFIVSLLIAAIILSITVSSVISLGIGLILIGVSDYFEQKSLQEKEKSLQLKLHMAIQSNPLNYFYINSLNNQLQLVQFERNTMRINNLASAASLILMLPVAIILAASIALPPIGVALLFVSLTISVLTTIGVTFYILRQRKKLDSIAQEQQAVDPEIDIELEDFSSPQVVRQPEKKLESAFKPQEPQTTVSEFTQSFISAMETENKHQSTEALEQGSQEFSI